jgi:hypothetical protein
MQDHRSIMADSVTQVGPGSFPSFVAGHTADYQATPVRTSTYWRSQRIPWLILLLALTLTIIDGAIRKWVIGSSFQLWSYAVYFSKDIAFAFLFLCPARYKASAALQTFRHWLVPGAFLLLCGALASSTETVSLAGAILTLRGALLLPVMAFSLIPRLPANALTAALPLITAFSVINLLLGIYQNQLPIGHELNRYAAELAQVTSTESGVRATGTFSYITGMGIFSVVGVWAGMVHLSLAQTSRQRLLGWITLVAALGCGLTSVSRWSIIVDLTMFLVWLFFSGNSFGKNVRMALSGAVLVALAIYTGVAGTFFELQRGMALRFETAGDPLGERAFGQLAEALRALEMAPLGNGLGTEQIGRVVHITNSLSDFANFESQFPRLVMETGALGLAGFLLIFFGAVMALEVAKRRANNRSHKAMLLATQLFLVPMIYTNIVFNHVASAFVWMIFTAVMASAAADDRRGSSAVDFNGTDLREIDCISKFDAK